MQECRSAGVHEYSSIGVNEGVQEEAHERGGEVGGAHHVIEAAFGTINPAQNDGWRARRAVPFCSDPTTVWNLGSLTFSEIIMLENQYIFHIKPKTVKYLIKIIFGLKFLI